MKEFRCQKCRKLLGKYRGNFELEIKCPRCGNNNYLLQTDYQTAASKRMGITITPALER